MARPVWSLLRVRPPPTLLLERCRPAPGFTVIVLVPKGVSVVAARAVVAPARVVMPARIPTWTVIAPDIVLLPERRATLPLPNFSNVPAPPTAPSRMSEFEETLIQAFCVSVVAPVKTCPLLMVSIVGSVAPPWRAAKVREPKRGRKSQPCVVIVESFKTVTLLRKFMFPCRLMAYAVPLDAVLPAFKLMVNCTKLVVIASMSVPFWT